MFNKEEIYAQVNELCKNNNVELLYLTVFGSTLYGTNISGKSDIDVRGIFLPSMTSLILGTDSNNIHYTSGNSNSRNTQNDIDIDLFSVQKWLLSLLPGGEIGATDLLFSPSNEECVIYKDKRLDKVFNNPLKFINTESNKSCAGYCINQIRKYGIKGTRLNVLKKVYEIKYTHNTRLRDSIKDIINACPDEDKYCKMLNENVLLLCGKQYQLNIKIEEFIQRVEKELENYKYAELIDENIDWKAVSHAYRVIYQNKEILNTGKITFPLEYRQEILDVKNRKKTWEECQEFILSGAEETERLRNTSQYAHDINIKDAYDVILSLY